MQTRLAPEFLDMPLGQEAESILRRCVHCGFCLSTCPTYRLTGNELDSPRGRIYLIKQLLEGKEAGSETQHHLDRCLGCRACETACPSGVSYHRLADIGRHLLEQQVMRHPLDRVKRAFLLRVLRNRPIMQGVASLGRLARPVVPNWTASLGERTKDTHKPAQDGEPWLLLAGCVQPALLPNVHAATRQVLAACGIKAISLNSCCGALAWHLNASWEGLNDMRQTIDQARVAFANGVAGLIYDATGCGATIAEYGRLLADDPAYATPAAEVAANAYDISTVVARHLDRLLPQLSPPADPRIAFHAPCSLQHGLRRKGEVETLLERLGYLLLPVSDAHQCCGSAGTYSLLQPKLAEQLRTDKLTKLMQGQPPVIATANVGCQCHLQAESPVPVRHWIELIAERLAATQRPA
ncbi:MAG: glycolate oxidase subunit GlcF [Burkholderiales bacterium]|nr:glycolate oxidase subunit GlcF [Burkholderiales bacterium]